VHGILLLVFKTWECTNLRKLTKRILISAATFLLAGPVFISPSTVSADKVTDTKTAISSNQSSSAKLLAQINEQENKVDKLNNDVSNKMVEIDKTQSSITDTEKHINDLTGQISTAQAELNDRKSVLREQLIELQKKSTNSVSGNIYVDFVLSSDDFTDLISRSFAVNKLNKANEQAMDAVDAAKNKLADLKDEQVSKKAQLVATKARLVTEKDSLVSAKKDAEAAGASLQKQLDDNKDVLESLQADLNKAVAAVKAAADAQAKQAAAARAAAAQRKLAAVKAVKSTVTGSSAVVSNAVNNVSSPSPASSTPSVSGGSIASNAAKYIGVPYAWGKATPADGFDCSGLIWYAAKQAGISLPRTSQDQSRLGKYVPVSALQAGDLVFWGGVGSAHHVGIYIGNGSYIHAPTTGKNVEKKQISLYFHPDFGRRL
jgi:cell wall-associated NlpC family hydrolase